MKKISAILATMVHLTLAAQTNDADLLNEEGAADFYKSELKATRIPVRPGVPGKAPFWNAYTKRFMYAPAFDFQIVEGAVKYRFTVNDEKGGIFIFTAKNPWEPLSPVWNDVAVGAVTVKAEGLDSKGRCVGLAGERLFYRLAIFNGPYRSSLTKTNTEAGLEGLRALLDSERFRYWLSEGKPFPGERLNCYPTKEMGASIRAMVQLSKLTADKEESQRALKTARNIADFLIDSLSVPAGKVMEYMPFVYWLDPHRTVAETPSSKKRAEMTMLSEPPRAILGYIELYEVCGEKKYLDAALRAARTYSKIMREDNTWPLMVEKEDGTVIEQMTFFPVCRGSSTVMKSFGKAFEVTGKEVYRAKAESIARTLVVTQQYHGGGEIPTFPMTSKNIYWTNNSCLNAMNLIILDQILSARQ